MLWYFVPKKRIYCLGKEDSGSVSFLAGSNEVDGWGAWARRAAGGMAHLVGWKRLDARGCHVYACGGCEHGGAVRTVINCWRPKTPALRNIIFALRSCGLRAT